MDSAQWFVDPLIPILGILGLIGLPFALLPAGSRRRGGSL